MGNRVTYRKPAKPVQTYPGKWDKVQDAAFSVSYWIVAVLFIIVATIGVWTFFGQKGNVIENSNQWAGYSEVGVHQIFDRKTGVMYAITDTGYMCLIVNEDGSPRMVD